MLSRRRFVLTAAATAPALGLSPASLRAQASPPQMAQGSTLPAPVLALANRVAEVKPLAPSERESRLDRARTLMKEYGFDAIVLTTGASLWYFTGARWGQSERLFAYVLPAAAAPFVICPAFERDHFADLLAHFPERDTTLTYLWQENESPYITLKRALAEVNITAGTVGLDDQVSFGHASGMMRACPSIKFVSARPVTAGCRSLKSPAEIAYMRLANQITLEVYRAVYQSCAPGWTTAQVEQLVAQAYARCGVRGEASCNVGRYTAIPHGSDTPQTIGERELVMLDDGCTVEGYTSDITRTFVYGTPDEQQRKVFDVVHRAQSAALAAARPGVEMQAVDAAARKVIADSGLGAGYDVFFHRLGHGIGLDMHEAPYLVGGNAQKLQASMTFSDEPGVYLPGKWGIRLEDDMLITDNGAELFTPQSPSLEHPFDAPAPTGA